MKWTYGRFRLRDHGSLTPDVPPSILKANPEPVVVPSHVWDAFERRGYATTDAGTIPDAVIDRHGWLVIRGMVVDGIFPDNAAGRRALKSHG